MEKVAYNLLKQNKEIYRMMLKLHTALDINLNNNGEHSNLKVIFDEINKSILNIIGVDSEVIEYWYSPADNYDDPWSDTSQTRLEELWDKYYMGRFSGSDIEEKVVHELKVLLIPEYTTYVEDEYSDCRDNSQEEYDDEY